MKELLQKQHVLAIGWVLTVCALVLGAFAVANAASIGRTMAFGDSGNLQGQH